MIVAGVVIGTLLYLFFGFLWVRFIVEWVQVFARSWSPQGVVLVALEGVYTVTDPPILALRKVIPPLRLGGFALDLSFLIVFLGVYLLIGLNGAIFF